MATGGQLSFLARGPLFDPKVMRQYLDDRRTTHIPDEESLRRTVRGWVASLVGASKKETALEQSFNSTILERVLGFQLFPASPATAYPKAPSSITGIAQEPDVLLGRFFRDEEPEPMAVLELKSPGTPLDRPQQREDRATPVEQAFRYGERILGVRWILVSDMRQIRLYSLESGPEFEAFDLATCAADGDEFRRLFYLLHHDYFVADGPESATAALLRKSLGRQREIKDSFYSTFYEIRMDVFAAVEAASASFSPVPSRTDVLEAVQRLLDRMLFLYYCEDAPDPLIPRETVANVTEAARRIPGPSEHKVYDALKALFREVDTGSTSASLVRLNGYNGELFKYHPIVDEIDLPDALHDRRYIVEEPEGGRRVVTGVWGLHKFDFWRELNEHLLGHIFEESLSDLVAIESGEHVPIAKKLAERKRHGIYYTTDILSDYLSVSALTSVLGEFETVPAMASEADAADVFARRLDRLNDLKIVDFACGSGAFLVSAYQALLQEFWSLQDAMAQLRGVPTDLFSHAAALSQAKLLREALFGSDLFPQAVEIAKLALWLRSARKGEKVADLGTNIIPSNSMHIDETLAAMEASLGEFDVVLGNPPWGGELGVPISSPCDALQLDSSIGWDSYELFLILAIRALRDGGRLALVLPDTFFRRDKSKTRQILLDYTRIEKLHNLGPGWFPNVKMGTLLLQARRGPKPITSTYTSMVVTGSYRERAIAGMLPLSQLEAQFGREIPQERSDESPDAEMEILRSVTDDEVMGRINSASVRLGELCWRGRGAEMSKSGLVWICPSCFSLTVPGAKAKGGGFKGKDCPVCGLKLNPANVTTDNLVRPLEAEPLGNDEAFFVDGDDISRRYVSVSPNKAVRLGVESINYKDGGTYRSPKVMIRKTGIGLVAALDTEDVRCPQTVFLYRLHEEALKRGYTHEFLLGVLLSRTFAYFVFKRFSEVDPDRSHAHVTYNRLDELPVPSLDRQESRDGRLAEEVTKNVRLLVEGEAELGGSEDWAIELALRELWGLSAEDGAYINGEFWVLPESQPLRDLFPQGVPKPARRSDIAA